MPKSNNTILQFVPTIQRASKITIRHQSGRMRAISREALLHLAQKGKLGDKKMRSFFTADSIEQWKASKIKKAAPAAKAEEKAK